MNNWARLLAAVSFLLLAGCDGRRAAVEKAVQGALKDPDSARFADEMTLYGPKDQLLACGQVNAKNSMGGYVGETAFMIWNGLIYFETQETGMAVENCCKSVYRESLKADGTPLSEQTSSLCRLRGEPAGLFTR